MIKKIQFALLFLLCLNHATWAQLIDDFNPRKLTWTETSNDKVWCIDTASRGVNELHGDSLLRSVGRRDHAAPKDCGCRLRFESCPNLEDFVCYIG